MTGLPAGSTFTLCEASTLSLPFSRSSTGTVRSREALAGQAHVEDDVVVDVDRFLGLQIVQVQVLGLVGIAEADEEQRHAHLRGILRRLAKVLALGGDAVGQHDDGGQRRAAEVVDDLAHRRAQLRRVVLRLGVELASIASAAGLEMLAPPLMSAMRAARVEQW